MKMALLATDSLHLERDDLGSAYRQLTGQPLRRTGMLAALALLAARNCMKHEQWPAGSPAARPTVLLWHAHTVMEQESRPLLQTMLQQREPLMPFQFLASQPALMGIAIKPHLPELSHAIGMPWPNAKGQGAWPRSLLLGAQWLTTAHCQRLICVQIDRTTETLQTHALSLGAVSADTPAIATLEPMATRTTTHLAAQDWVARLRQGLATTPAATLVLDGIRIQPR